MGVTSRVTHYSTLFLCIPLQFVQEFDLLIHRPSIYHPSIHGVSMPSYVYRVTVEQHHTEICNLSSEFLVYPAGLLSVVPTKKGAQEAT